MLKYLKKNRKWGRQLVGRGQLRPQKPRPLGKSLPEDKTLGVDPAILFYELEDSDDTE